MGAAIMKANWSVHGVSLGEKSVEQCARVDDCVAEAARVLDIDVTPAHALVDDGHVGAGYSLPGAEVAEAIQQTPRLEEIVLYPIYTGKAMANLFSAARSGSLDSDKTVVLPHAGGSAALHTYPSSLNLPPRVEANLSRGLISTSRR